MNHPARRTGGVIVKTGGIGMCQATSIPVDLIGSGGVMSMGRSSSLPDRKIPR
jgi:hypothetical protein